MLLFHLILIAVVNTVYSQNNADSRTLNINQGPIRGFKEDGIFIFYDIPYATAPWGENKFKAPLNPPVWQDTFEAVDRNKICPQFILPNNIQDDCLTATVYVPDTDATNLPVVVFVHGGAYAFGSGNLLRPITLVQSQRVIAVTFNYRLGLHGFLCLGTDKAPGNSGMKDQVELLRWVNRNIANFGGNPEDVTIAGSSAGSVSVDLIMLSGMAQGLFTKVIRESGTNLVSWAVQMDPLEEAKNFARLNGFENIDDLDELESFYTSASWDIIFNITHNLERTDSSLGFVPCIEKDIGEERFLIDAPVNIIKQGTYTKVPILCGFTDQEGLYQVENGHYEVFRTIMNEKFSDFLPPDLKFVNDEEREAIATEVKQFYFGENEVNDNTIDRYVDFFTDTMFAYGSLKSVKLHLEAGNDKVYLYEYSFDAEELPPALDRLNLRGASHAHQTYLVLDGTFDYINVSSRTQDMIHNIQTLWLNFITDGAPVIASSSLPAWNAVSNIDRSPHMSLDATIEARGPLLLDRARFWDDIYEKHYLPPTAPPSAAPAYLLSPALLLLVLVLGQLK